MKIKTIISGLMLNYEVFYFILHDLIIYCGTEAFHQVHKSDIPPPPYDYILKLYLNRSQIPFIPIIQNFYLELL